MLRKKGKTKKHPEITCKKKSSSSSSSSYDGVRPLVDPFQSHMSISLF